MSVRVQRPTTPGRRGMTSRDLDQITKKRPEKSLLKTRAGTVGRSKGKITIRHRGGGVKRYYRQVDFRGSEGWSGTVRGIEYDPNRSAHIALIEADDGSKHYVLAETRMRVGQKVQMSTEAAIKPGNRLPLQNIPPGTAVYNLELRPGAGGQLVRSAGATAQLTAKDDTYAHIKLPSGEIRLIRLDCYATIGNVGNEAHQHIKWGSAGRRRRLGWRPTVRGKATNPVDHPMGGGEGQTGPGRIPRTPWGKIAIGAKTRRRKSTNKYIVRGRKVGKRA
ncbi:50S ribosomal protein L2 [Candidatus Microgenomates bacterium]|nr:50S ribosomal protein L2 [Candidatus Microgenomates bacterium]